MGIFSHLGILGTVGIALLLIETDVIIFLAIYIRRIKGSLVSEGIREDFLLNYDESQGVFYYPVKAIQRKFGYCQLYDEGAAGLGMVIDCEPVRFTWGGRNWLIEMWKGQYGITAGAEIGVYSTTDLISDAKSAIYLDTDTLLEMEVTLTSDKDKVFVRGEKTWWLTGFVLGMFVWPDQLRAEVKIEFPERGMARAFVDELSRMGYKSEEIYRRRDSVMVLFTEPKSSQPRIRESIGEETQKINKYFVNLYNDTAERFGSVEEMLKYLKRHRRKLYRYLTKGMRRYKVPVSNKTWKRGGK